MCAYRAHGSILRMASSYEWLVHDPKSEDIIYIREIFPDTMSMAQGSPPPGAIGVVPGNVSLIYIISSLLGSNTRIL